MFRVSRLRQDYRKIAGRRPWTAKPPRSHREAIVVQLPCSAPLRPSHSPEAQCLSCRRSSHGLNLTQRHGSANVKDVCGTSVREARRSHSAKPQSCREASRSQPFHKLWLHEASPARPEPLKKTMLKCIRHAVHTCLQIVRTHAQVRPPCSAHMLTDGKNDAPVHPPCSAHMLADGKNPRLADGKNPRSSASTVQRAHVRKCMHHAAPTCSQMVRTHAQVRLPCSSHMLADGKNPRSSASAMCSQMVRTHAQVHSPCSAHMPADGKNPRSSASAMQCIRRW